MDASTSAVPDPKLLLKSVLDRYHGHLLPATFALALNDTVKGDLHLPWEVESHRLFDDVCSASLATLAADADEVLVSITNVLRVDRDVRHRPCLHPLTLLFGLGPSFGLKIQALLDGVLVSPSKGTEDKVASVRVTGFDGHIVASGNDFDDTGEVGAIKVRGNALGVEVEREGEEVDISCTLAIAEQTPFDTLTTS